MDIFNFCSRRKTQKKFHYQQNWEVAEAGWLIKFKTAWERKGGDGVYDYRVSAKKGKKENWRVGELCYKS